jgi:hypothetical protein
MRKTIAREALFDARNGPITNQNAGRKSPTAMPTGSDCAADHIARQRGAQSKIKHLIFVIGGPGTNAMTVAATSRSIRRSA